jgi:hypothetical protein
MWHQAPSSRNERWPAIFRVLFSPDGLVRYQIDTTPGSLTTNVRAFAEQLEQSRYERSVERRDSCRRRMHRRARCARRAAGHAGESPASRCAGTHPSPAVSSSTSSRVASTASGAVASFAIDGASRVFEAPLVSGVYSARVRARNACGESAPSNEVIAYVS